jgi:hypothetical protein
MPAGGVLATAQRIFLLALNFTDQIIQAALQNGTRLVIGTTGHSDAQRTLIREALLQLPIVYRVIPCYKQNYAPNHHSQYLLKN